MSDTAETVRWTTVARSLVSLGFDPGEVRACVVLSSGASGAGAYRLRLERGDLVLKVAPPESPRHVLERAIRELRFYRELAPDVSVRIPDVIASRCDPAIGACLVMRAYDACPEPRDWTASMYVRAAELLGRMHAGFWGTAGRLSRLRWLRSATEPREADIRHARGLWERLWGEKRFGAVLTPERRALVRGVLDRLDTVKVGQTALPGTLCHGDFHIDNLLVGPSGELVIADWQEAGPGLGPEDLTFFIQRASYSGGAVPVEVMIDAYRRTLIAGVGGAVPLGEIRRVMEIAELRTRLLHWPAYLVGAPGGQVAAMVDRIETLAARLGAA